MSVIPEHLVPSRLAKELNMIKKPFIPYWMKPCSAQ